MGMPSIRSSYTTSRGGDLQRNRRGTSGSFECEKGEKGKHNRRLTIHASDLIAGFSCQERNRGKQRVGGGDDTRGRIQLSIPERREEGGGEKSQVAGERRKKKSNPRSILKKGHKPLGKENAESEKGITVPAGVAKQSKKQLSTGSSFQPP